MKKLKKALVLMVMLLCMTTVSSFSETPFSTVQTVQAAAKLNKTKATLIKGQKLQLKVNGNKKKVKWSSSRKRVASVSGNGKVTARAKGTSVITAKVGNKKYTCKITVETPRISKSSISMGTGKKYTLKVNGTKQKVKWSSSNKAIATVSSKGVVTGKKAGSVKITAKVGSKKYICKVTVKKGRTTSNTKNNTSKRVLSVNQSSITINGLNTTESVKITSTTGGSMEYNIVDSSVARCKWGSWSGNSIPLYITGIKNGSTTVRVTDDDTGDNILIYVIVKSAGSNLSANYNTLKSYIINNGMTNSSGNKFIRNSDAAMTEGIVYESASGRLNFVATAKFVDTTVSIDMYVDLVNDSYIRPEVIVVDSRRYGSVRGNATIYAPTYVKDTDVTFNITKKVGTGISEYSYQNIANSYLQLAFTEWDLLLYQKTGLSLYDLGFRNYE